MAIKRGDDSDDYTGIPITKEIVAKIFKKQREISKRGLSAQIENTETCWSFYNADQMTYSDRIQFEDTWGRKRRAMVNFNKVQSPIDSVNGFMMQTRRQAKFTAHVPKDQNQQLYSKNMNSLYNYHRAVTNADQLESDRNLSTLVSGVGAIDTELSYVIGNATTMPNGEIVKKVLEHPYWDPSARAKNIEDRRWDGYHEDFELRDALKLFQDSKQADFEEVADDDPSDTGYTFNPYGGIYDKIKLMNTVEWTSKESEMVRVYKHEWMDYETFYKAENPLYQASEYVDAQFIKLKLDSIKAQIKQPGDTTTEDMFEFEPSKQILVFDEPTKRALVKAFGKSIEPIPFKRKVFYTAVISGEHVFTWFKSVCQQGFSIKFTTGVWNRNKKMWMGMVNPLMEPSKFSNKAITELLFTIAANSKGGVMIEEDAVEDIADFEGKWAKTDAVIKVASGALAAGKIQEKAKGAMPTGLEYVIQLTDANISANSVDPSFLGQLDDTDQSGVLYRRRIRQVVAKLGRYVDADTMAQKEDARMMADLIPIWVQNNQGEWIRITGPDGADDFVQIMEDMLAPQYDVDIQEAALSADEKEETGVKLGNIGQQFLAVQDTTTAKVFIGEALNFMNLDGDARQRLTQALAPQQQIDPQQFQALQQQVQQLTQYIQSGETDRTKSETMKNNAQAAKTLKDADISVATVPLRHAETVKTLEEARHTAVQAHTPPATH